MAAAPHTEEREESVASLRNQEVAAVMKLFALACRLVVFNPSLHGGFSCPLLANIQV